MDPAWAEYRRRRLVFRLTLLFALLWFLPGAMLTEFLAKNGVNKNLAFLLIMALPMLGSIAVAHLRRMLWPCPRCKRAFHVTWFYGSPFSRRCLHCGLPLWAPVPAQTEITSSVP
jgi:uncharacterized membrane protein